MINGHKVRAYRKRLGWTRADLAEHTGLSVRFIARIETGKNQDQGPDMMLLLSKTLLVDPEDIQQ